MANMQKYKLGQIGHILDENARDEKYHAERIDSELTKNNYFLSKHCDYSPTNSAPRLDEMANRLAAAISNHEKVAGRSIRSDANLVFSWVVTAPENLRAEDERAFFTATHRFLCDRYGGEDNCLTSVVHKDEPTCRAHLHFDAMPIIDGKFQASKMVNRADLRTIHSQMNAYVDKELGYHVSIELDEKEVAKKALSKVPHRELTAAKAAIAAEEKEAQQRLECLRQRVAPLERECRELENEEQDLKAENQRLAANSGTAERDQRFESERRELRGRCDVLEEVLGGLVAKIKELLGEIPIPERLVEILEEFGLRSSSRDYAEVDLGLDAKAHEAVEASWAMQREVGNRKNSQGWESPDGR